MTDTLDIGACLAAHADTVTASPDLVDRAVARSRQLRRRQQLATVLTAAPVVAAAGVAVATLTAHDHPQHDRQGLLGTTPVASSSPSTDPTGVAATCPPGTFLNVVRSTDVVATGTSEPAQEDWMRGFVRSDYLQSHHLSAVRALPATGLRVDGKVAPHDSALVTGADSAGRQTLAVFVETDSDGTWRAFMATVTGCGQPAG